jgi:hypothetical protein
MYTVNIRGKIYNVSGDVTNTIDQYVETGDMSSDFLRSVLENNLKDALHKADAVNFENLPAIVNYCHWEIPSGCWGSKDKVQAWILQGGLEGKGF